MLRLDWSERVLSRWGKGTTVLLGLVALVLAMEEVRMIFWFVLFAWSGLACSFAPVVLCGLFWKGTTRAGAIAGMATGFVVTVSWVLFFKASFYDLYEMIPGFLAGIVATVLVSLATAPPEEAAEELAEIRAAVGPVL